METLVIILTFITLYLFTKHILTKTKNHPPTPFLSLPIIGHLYLLKKPLHRSLADISKRHGPVVLLQLGSRRVVVVSSPSVAEECFTKNDVFFANRPRMLIGKHMGYNFTSLAWASYGDYWRNLRRISSIEILSSTRLQTLCTLRADEVTSLVRRLVGNWNGNGLVDLKKEFFELTMNVMMRMIAGKRYYGEIEAGESEKANRFRMIRDLTSELTGLTNSADFLPWVSRFGGLEKRFIDCQKMRNEFMKELIGEHRNNMRKHNSNKLKQKTLIEVLLEFQETEPDYYTDDIISGLMLVLLVAGTDTTVNAMEWTFSLLMNHPEELKKAQQQIDNKVGFDRLITESDIAQLPHLRNIINESLRLYPPAPLLMPHESSQDCTLQGYRIPRGTTLFVNIWAIQNDPKIWKDPREFKPERFEEMDGFKSLPFGSGRRACPGEGLALRMVGLTLGTLLQCFDWSSVGEMVDMSEGIGFTLSRAHPLLVNVKPRPVMFKLLSRMECV